jgi:hypothetical protein
MIFDGLHTSLVFYDDIDKQNRYRDICEAVCDYRQLFPLDYLPPFQIKVEEDPGTVLSYFYIRCENGEIYADLFSLFGRIDIDTEEGVATYITALETDIKELFPCGNYYFEVAIENESGIHTYYSECFSVVPDIANPEFQQQIFPLYSAWPWYDNQLKITENKAPCDQVCGYYLRSGNDALIPFQYRVDDATMINSWTLVATDCTFPLDVNLLEIQDMGDYKNIIYSGGNIELPCGVFYGEMVIDGVTHYSEPIYISNDFETNTTNYILQEDGDKLLQEDSFGLLHEP